MFYIHDAGFVQDWRGYIAALREVFCCCAPCGACRPAMLLLVLNQEAGEIHGFMHCYTDLLSTDG